IFRQDFDDGVLVGCMMIEDDLRLDWRSGSSVATRSESRFDERLGIRLALEYRDEIALHLVEATFRGLFVRGAPDPEQIERLVSARREASRVDLSGLDVEMPRRNRSRNRSEQPRSIVSHHAQIQV